MCGNNESSKISPFEMDTCPICLDIDSNGDTIKCDLCVAVYCRKCIYKWNSRDPTCPYCRQIGTLKIPPKPWCCGCTIM